MSRTTPLTPARSRAITRGIARSATVLLIAVMSLPVLAAASHAANVPDFQPVQPAGGDALLALGGNIKWVALLGIPAVFFAGLVCLGFGKIVDHRGAHRIGMGMTLSAVGVAIAVGAGIPFLNSFTG